jgi:hypothetical protein
MDMFRWLRKFRRAKEADVRQRQQALSGTPDNYPGDAAFTALLQRIYHGPPGPGGTPGTGGVSHDKIDLAWDRKPGAGNGQWTRTEIVQALLARYASRPSGGTTCKAFLGNANITLADCLKALTYPAGYPGPSGWQKWAGSHDGCWYQDNSAGVPDDARWHAPTKKGAHAPAGTAYDFQPVDFLRQGGGIARHGWNQSHPDVAYVWGWDPKDIGAEHGEIGAHLGFQFSSGGADGIIWFTPKEVFLEAVSTVNGVRRRISVGLRGVGQWTIQP